MSTANRRDIARKISENTGYYIQDVEEILSAETDAISDLLEEGYTKVKNHKFMQ
ncbi:HU family DNA-binding protein, partial [Klebsiella pneumoniae]